MRTKACCIQSLREAKLAITHGAHAIGFVSQMSSGIGFMTPDDVIRTIITELSSPIATFLITSLTNPAQLIAQQRSTGASTLQLLGTQSPDLLHDLRKALPGITLIKVVPV